MNARTGKLDLHQLLARYAHLVGGSTVQRRPNLIELTLPEQIRALFGGGAELLVATDPEALEEAPNAVLATPGSRFLEQLLAAVRDRGHRLHLGLIAPSLSPDASHASLAVKTSGLVVHEPRVTISRHPVGRMVARVLVRAGAAAEESIIESYAYDFVTGHKLSGAVAAQISLACVPVNASSAPSAAPAKPPRPASELVPLMLDDLEQQLEPQLSRQKGEAQRSLAAELARIDKYYETLLEGPAGPGTEIVSANERVVFEAEHVRRREEEMRRHSLRATLEPIQLVEAELLVQDAEWTLASPAGHQGRITAVRTLTGDGAWTMSCATCGGTPSELRVCEANHVCCADCSQVCATCGIPTCSRHAPPVCHVDGQPSCLEHARTCLICRQPYCTRHQATCGDGAHHVCSACIVSCALCSRSVCTTHATASAPGAPKGRRWLCRDCVVLCEGGKNEPVGRDEVERCASCERHVCGAHQAVCAVDARVHCSNHLRRADRSRRLVCEWHRGVCAYEPAAVFAADEVRGCTTCGSIACNEHVGFCYLDSAVHCMRHLTAVVDVPGQFACEQHRSLCHVDGRAFTSGAVWRCPVCAATACREHFAQCSRCARAVCVSDVQPLQSVCATCKRLAPVQQVDPLVWKAAAAACGGSPPPPNRWLVASDAGHVVVDIDLGWTRHVLFTVPHGADTPFTVMARSAVGTQRRR